MKIYNCMTNDINLQFRFHGTSKVLKRGAELTRSVQRGTGVSYKEIRRDVFGICTDHEIRFITTFLIYC